jgi:glycine/D-amino acid oxidase-like deaminating enzyme
MLGIELPVGQRYVQSHVSEPAPPIIGHLVCHAERILTLKQVANGNVIIGGGWPAKINAAPLVPMVLRESIAGNLWTATSIVPTLGRLKMLRSWAGINIASDGRPILGEVPGVPGFFNAIPSDSGLTLGPIGARLVADQVAGKSPSVDMRPYAVDRFARPTQ